MLALVCVEGAFPADVEDGADRATAAESVRVCAIVMACLAVCGPHVAVEKSAYDGEPVAWVFMFVEKLVLAPPNARERQDLADRW